MPGQARTRQHKRLIEAAMPKEELLTRIASGQTFHQIIKELEPAVGRPISLYYLFKTLQGFGEDYEEAKRMRAAYHADRISMTTDLVELGEMDAGTARIASDNHKWLAKVGDPSRYGDRIQADVTVMDIGRLHLEALRERMRSYRSAIAPSAQALSELGVAALPAPPIEGEVVKPGGRHWPRKVKPRVERDGAASEG